VHEHDHEHVSRAADRPDGNVNEDENENGATKDGAIAVPEIGRPKRRRIARA
jgi:hypothetical protein